MTFSSVADARAQTLDPEFEAKAVNTIRMLAAEGVQAANSGHPGLPMGMAQAAFVLWTRYMRHNPHNPHWNNRDRFVLSAGHGSMLLYTMLHLTGYDLPLEELKNFRQWGSKTPGHPEVNHTPGVETTTGPLGQGFANGVGMAIAERWLAARYNRESHTVVDHYTYAIVSDGDLMEGIASEAASIAGHLRLGKLIYLYDDNRITIDGKTDLSYSEDWAKRFDAYGWHVQSIDGMDGSAVATAIEAAHADPRPSIIGCRTTIGYGSPNRAGTSKAHGEALGEDEFKATKENIGWPSEPRFYLPDDALAFFREAVDAARVGKPNTTSNLKPTIRPIPNWRRNFATCWRGICRRTGKRRFLPSRRAKRRPRATPAARFSTPLPKRSPTSSAAAPIWPPATRPISKAAVTSHGTISTPVISALAFANMAWAASSTAWRCTAA